MDTPANVNEAERKARAEKLRAIWETKRREWTARGEKLTQEAVAAQLDVTQSSISQYLLGRVPLNDRFLLQLAQLLRFDPRDVHPDIVGLPAWMLERSSEEDGLLPLGVGGSLVISRPSRMVPLLSYEDVGKWLAEHDAMLAEQEFEMLACYRDVGDLAFAMEVRGHAMAAPNPGADGTTFPEGTRIIVDPSVKARHGSYVAAIVDGATEPVLRRLSIDGPSITLVPLDARYPILTATGSLTIVGTVVAVAERPVPY